MNDFCNLTHKYNNCNYIVYKMIAKFLQMFNAKKNKNLLVYFPLDKKHWKHLIIGSLSKNITSN